jgi:hypothetical protein
VVVLVVQLVVEVLLLVVLKVETQHLVLLLPKVVDLVAVML